MEEEYMTWENVLNDARARAVPVAYGEGRRMGTPEVGSGSTSELAGRRKAEHIDLCRTDAVEVAAPCGWDDIHLLHEALPELERGEVRLDVSFLGHRLAAPLMIASMTGGVEHAATINQRLARLAERFGLAMGLGSGRIMLEDPAQERSFRVAREAAPAAFLAANIGAPQLVPQRGRPGYPPERVLRLVEVIGAQALVVHLNFLQEAVQPEGDTNARGVLAAIAALAAAAPVPVLVKEIGCGIGRRQAEALARAGVAAIDVAGQGGTSWALVEAERAEARGEQLKARLGRTFAAWGIPTPVAIRLAAAAGRPVIASGGIRSGLDAARALALGATLAGVARPLLAAALQGDEALVEWTAAFLEELRTALFLTGSADLASFHARQPVITGQTAAWLAQLERSPVSP
jgi:isopentenyl-diphosphate delta-isomerase